MARQLANLGMSRPVPPFTHVGLHFIIWHSGHGAETAFRQQFLRPSQYFALVEQSGAPCPFQPFARGSAHITRPKHSATPRNLALETSALLSKDMRRTINHSSICSDSCDRHCNNNNSSSRPLAKQPNQCSPQWDREGREPTTYT